MSQETALLVVDAQTLMFAEKDPVYQSNEILARIADLIARARAAGVPILYVQHTEPEGSDLAPGTPGWEIPPAIAPVAGEPTIQKHFPDSFQDTTLRDELEARKIQKLILVGMQTEMCIDTTCRRAFSLGYQVTLVEDAHSTWDSQIMKAAQTIAHHNSVLGGCFATLQKAEETAFQNG